MLRYGSMLSDDNGWATGLVEPWPPAEAWNLLSPEPGARIDAPRWAHQADAFFRARLVVVGEKRYPAGTLPLVDRALVDVAARDAEGTTRVEVTTVPLDRSPEAQRAAAAGVKAIGGAGFDALVAKGKRLWQVHARVEPTGDPRAPLVVAAVLASLFLAPVVPPEGGTIFGVKGCRERLAKAGWKG